jgi:hypothetical protein
MGKEVIIIAESKIRDFTKKSGSWEIDNEKYNFIDTFLDTHGEGESHAVIVQRESDGKYFQFGWDYYHDNYGYEPEWCSVIPQVVTKTIWRQEK